MTSERAWLKPLLLVIAVLVGVGSATQSRINGTLAETVGSGPHAAAIAFGTGLALLLLLTACVKSARAGLRRTIAAARGGEMPWWGFLGGACGASFVLAQGLSVPFLGVAVFMTSMVVGQLLGSLAVDHFGWLGAPVQRISWMRGIGTLLALLAVGLVGLGGGVTLGSTGFMAIGAVAGFLVALQLGITGTVRQHARESVSPALINFAVGFAVLLGAALLASLLGLVEFSGLPREWWLYLGGVIGVIYIFVTASVVRGLGVFMLSLSLVGGQLVGSLFFDLLSGHFSWLLLCGVVLAFVGILVSHLGARRGR